MLDENVLIRAIARGKVEYRSARFVRVGDEDWSASDLLVSIMRNGHGLAISAELWERYQRHRARLQESGISANPHPMDLIAQGWAGRVRSISHPTSVTLPDSFPSKDRYLAHLALEAGAALVTEDEGIHTAAGGSALSFEVLHIADALEWARQPA